MKTGQQHTVELTEEEVKKRLERARRYAIEKQQSIEREQRRRRAYEQLKQQKENETIDANEVAKLLRELI